MADGLLHCVEKGVWYPTLSEVLNFRPQGKQNILMLGYDLQLNKCFHYSLSKRIFQFMRTVVIFLAIPKRKMKGYLRIVIVRSFITKLKWQPLSYLIFFFCIIGKWYRVIKREPAAERKMRCQRSTLFCNTIGII